MNWRQVLLVVAGLAAWLAGILLAAAVAAPAGWSWIPVAALAATGVLSIVLARSFLDGVAVILAVVVMSIGLAGLNDVLPLPFALAMAGAFALVWTGAAIAGIGLSK
jgi:hypothetical protein